MKHLAADTPVMSEAEGTVLLDELELHLHPVWKVKIVEKLRTLFPRVRFVITTHDPLCLRGLNRRESHLFSRDPDDDHVTALDLDLRPGMNADELLTGGWFGLGTTLDKETEEMIYKLSILSLKEDRLRIIGGNAALPAAEQTEMDVLHRELQVRLPGLGGAASEKQALADAVRGNFAISEIDMDSSEDLAEKLRAAFSDQQQLP